MIYSCFNETAGHYEYFEDDRAQAMNGDLPVPVLARKQAGKVGVPARDAGRPLPSDAKPAGTGWAARGMIVQCKTKAIRGLRGFGQETNGVTTKDILYVLGAVGLGYAVSHQTGKDPIVGAIGGGALALIVVALF